MSSQRSSRDNSETANGTVHLGDTVLVPTFAAAVATVAVGGSA